MSFLQSTKTAPYKGLVMLPLRTLTSSYVPLGGGNIFVNNSLIAMEANVHINSQSFYTGMQVRIFDVIAGITELTFGDVSTTHTFFDGPLYVNGNIQCWLPDSLGGYQMDGYKRAIQLGQSMTTTEWSPQQLRLLNNTIPNTISPGPNDGANWLTVDGSIYMSNWLNDIQQYNLWRKDGSITFNNWDNASNPFNNTRQIISLIPWQGMNWFRLNIASNTDPGNRLMSVTPDFSIKTLYNTSIINPPGNFDVAALWNDDSQEWDASAHGWMTTTNGDVTVEGKLLHGASVLMAPDFSGYIVIGYIPQDAIANDWYNKIGFNQTKFDYKGNILMSNVSFRTIILYAAWDGSIVRRQAQPPVPIPNPYPECEENITIMEGNWQ